MTEHVQINDVTPRIIYVANGAQAAFTFPFAIFKAADLEVYLDGVKQLAGFTVTGAGTTTGGSATFTVAPGAGVQVALRRKLSLARTSDYQADGIIRAKTLNDELDYQVAATQQVSEEAGRAVKRSPTSPSTADLTLPEPVAGRALKWAADGLSLVNSDNDPDQVVANAQAAAAAAQTARAEVEAVKAGADLAKAGADAAKAGAEAAAAAASASAAAVNLPSAAGHGGDYIRQKETEDGFEYRTPTQVLDDIGGPSLPDMLSAIQSLRDQLALTNHRLTLSTSQTSAALVQGYQWELPTDEWATGSSGQTYVNVPGGVSYYHNPSTDALIPAGAGTIIGDLTSGGYGGIGAAFNGVAGVAHTSSAVKVGATSGYIGKIYGGAGYKIAKIVAHPSTDLGFNGGGGTTALTAYYKTGAAPSVETDGIAFAATTGNPTSGSVTLTSPDRTTSFTGAWFAIAGPSGAKVVAELDIYEAVPPPNMTLLSPLVEAPSVPAAMVANFLWMDASGDAVLGVDTTVELTRCGGAAWTVATPELIAAYDGTYGEVRARADVSGQPAGTSMMARIGTHNNKAQRVAAPAVAKE